MSDESTKPDLRFSTLSGRAVVIGMFAFAILLTLALRWYWNKHIEPFMPLQLALAERFADSSPRVEGGQRKMHMNTPRVLRVTMRVAWDPTDESDETAERVAGDLDVILETAAQHLDLSIYHVLECHFFQPAPEQSLRHATFTRTLNDP